MPLYLGLDAGPIGLTAVLIEVEGNIRRVVFTRTINFDRDLPGYGTTGGVRRLADGDLPPSPVMWADALDRVLGRLAAAAEIEVERIHAIAGAAHDADGVLHQHLPDSRALDPSVALPAQLKASSAIAGRFESLSAYFEALLSGPNLRLSPVLAQTIRAPRRGGGALDRRPVRARDRHRHHPRRHRRHLVRHPRHGHRRRRIGARHSRITFRNGGLARDQVRSEHRLEWDQVAPLLEQSPGNDGCVLLPWVERETTPPISHAGVRRFGFDRHDTGRNVRGLIEGQMMAMANHVPVPHDVVVDKVIAMGGAAANRAILQVTANVFGAEVHRLDTEHPAALGAALRAYHADRLTVGEPVSWKTVVSGFTEPQPGHRVSPNPKHVAMYAALRKDYAMLERLHQHRAPIC